MGQVPVVVDELNEYLQSLNLDMLSDQEVAHVVYNEDVFAPFFKAEPPDQASHTDSSQQSERLDYHTIPPGNRGKARNGYSYRLKGDNFGLVPFQSLPSIISMVELTTKLSMAVARFSDVL
jgi:hypothetical protein